MDYFIKKAANYAKEYPYTAMDGTCTENLKERKEVHSTGHEMVKKNNVDALKEALVQWPVSVAIDASGMAFNMYKGGIFPETSCKKMLDHAVQVVGWGTEKNQEYWIVRNSWGPSWGEEGYIRFEIVSGKGTCGIQKGPSLIHM